MLKADVVIIGSEGAGARAAIGAHQSGAEVLLVSKGRMGRSGATVTAIADMDVDSKSAIDVLGLDGDAEDSQHQFFEDILAEGKYINNQEILELHVKEAPERIRELMDWGMKVKTLFLGPGHRYPRGVLTSGSEIVKALGRQVGKLGIRVVEDMMAVEILTRDGVAVGVLCFDLKRGEFVPILAAATVLATGGGMMVYPIQTAPHELSGDGQAMAYRAGAEFIDMEMTQFHPCNFLTPPAWKGTGFPFTIGPAGGMEGWLLNKYGQRFMAKWDPERMEKSTRDLLSIGIMTEVLEGRGSPSGGVYLSFRHLPLNLIDDFVGWFSKGGLVGPNWEQQGFHFGKLMEEVRKGYAIEVAPASHFFMGGIRVGVQCETCVPGLYAAGEVAGGTHGANRLSGNALTQVLVQGARAGVAAAAYASETGKKEADGEQIAEVEKLLLGYLEREPELKPIQVRKELQQVAWEKAGVVREGETLRSALEWVKRFRKERLPLVGTGAKERQYNREWVEAIQLESLLTILEAVAGSALVREESRGAHYRKDFRETHAEWLCNVIARRDGKKMSFHTEPIVATRWKMGDKEL